MVLANSKTHIEPLDTFHDAGAHDLDILLKGTIVHRSHTEANVQHISVQGYLLFKMQGNMFNFPHKFSLQCQG